MKIHNIKIPAKHWCKVAKSNATFSSALLGFGRWYHLALWEGILSTSLFGASAFAVLISDQSFVGPFAAQHFLVAKKMSQTYMRRYFKMMYMGAPNLLSWIKGYPFGASPFWIHAHVKKLPSLPKTCENNRKCEHSANQLHNICHHLEQKLCHGSPTLDVQGLVAVGT